MQRSRPDHREVGCEDSKLHLPLDLSKKVLEGRVLLDDHRRPFGLGVVDDDVHLVLPERKLPDEGLELGRDPGLLRHAEEGLEILEYVVLNGVDVLGDLRNVGILLF